MEVLIKGEGLDQVASVEELANRFGVTFTENGKGIQLDSAWQPDTPKDEPEANGNDSIQVATYVNQGASLTLETTLVKPPHAASGLENMDKPADIPGADQVPADTDNGAEALLPVDDTPETGKPQPPVTEGETDGSSATAPAKSESQPYDEAEEPENQNPAEGSLEEDAAGQSEPGDFSKVDPDQSEVEEDGLGIETVMVQPEDEIQEDPDINPDAEVEENMETTGAQTTEPAAALGDEPEDGQDNQPGLDGQPDPAPTGQSGQPDEESAPEAGPAGAIILVTAEEYDRLVEEQQKMEEPVEYSAAQESASVVHSSFDTPPASYFDDQTEVANGQNEITANSGDLHHS